jgi:hypothetical protein
MATKSEDNSREFLRAYEFRIGTLSTPIRMRVFRRKADGKLLIEQSHFLKTSIQYLPYAVNELDSADEAVAMRELENIFLGFYDQAVRRGYPVKENWLVPNTGFQKA